MGAASRLLELSILELSILELSTLVRELVSSEEARCGIEGFVEPRLDALVVFSIDDRTLVLLEGISDLLRDSLEPAAEKVGTYSLRLLCR